MESIVAAILGATSAYLFNYFHWKVVEDKNTVSSLCRLITDTIDVLEKNSVEYWLEDSFDKANIRKQIEITIKAKCEVLSRQTEQLFAKVSPEQPASRIYKIRDSVNQIYDIATGDDFESLNRKSDPVKAAKIGRLCTKVKIEVITMYH